MNYKKIYENLIKYRKTNIPTGYTENHHILPRSMGGSNEADNLVKLTGREHWIAHLLLYKIHKNSQTAHACHMMAMKCEERGIPQVRNSRMYEAIRIKCIELIGNHSKNHQKGKGNSQFGTIWISNPLLKINAKVKKENEIPEGWFKGRNSWKNEELKIKKKKIRQILKFRKVLLDRKNNNKNKKIKKIFRFRDKKYYEKLYNIMIKQNLSLRQMKDYYPKSHVSLYKNFKKYGIVV